MKKNEVQPIIICFLIFLLVTSSCLPRVNSKLVNDTDIHSKTTLFVGGNGPENYSCIQNAIDDAFNGFTIYVYNGSYFETIHIDKEIRLIGENKDKTIIDGGKHKENQSLVLATSDHVEITGFTLQNAKGLNGRAGMFMNEFPQLYSAKNVFKDNIIRNCSYGVMFVNPVDNIICDNALFGCGIGPHLTIPFYFDNVFENNTVNGKPSILYAREKNKVIDKKETDSLIFIFCENMEIKNLSISNTTVGIDIMFCNNINVSNCTISETKRGGIYVHHSNFCSFEDNNFINDKWGVFLRKSNFNKIQRNNFLNISMPDWFASSYGNQWNANYWDEPVEGIKMIFGKIGFFENIPWYNFDVNPKLEPFKR